MKNVLVENAWEVMNIAVANGNVHPKEGAQMFLNNLNDAFRGDDQYFYGGSDVDFKKLYQELNWGNLPQGASFDMYLEFSKFFDQNKLALNEFYYGQDRESFEHIVENF